MSFRSRVDIEGLSSDTPPTRQSMDDIWRDDRWSDAQHLAVRFQEHIGRAAPAEIAALTEGLVEAMASPDHRARFRDTIEPAAGAAALLLESPTTPADAKARLVEAIRRTASRPGADADFQMNEWRFYQQRSVESALDALKRAKVDTQAVQALLDAPEPPPGSPPAG